MERTIDEIVDIVLKSYYKARNAPNTIDLLLFINEDRKSTVHLKDEKYNDVKRKILSNKLVNYSFSTGTHGIYSITIFGIEIIESGGWLKHLKREKKESQLKIWQIKLDVISKPVMVLLTIISICVAIASLSNSQTNEQKTKELQTVIESLKIKVAAIESTNKKQSLESQKEKTK